MNALNLKPEQLQWWRDAKFGMFIHWGLYSIRGRGEWDVFINQVEYDEYRKLADEFTPKNFDPLAWTSLAKEAGMRYAVLTARHHDGYSLFRSESSYEHFTSVDTAARTDFVDAFTNACRHNGLRTGLYYSPLDWRFPGFFFPEMYRSNALKLKAQTYGQIRELLSRYGKIDILWYDGGGDPWLGLGGLRYSFGTGWHRRPKGETFQGTPLWEAEKLAALARELQPEMLINDRSGWAGDFSTREFELGGYESEKPWEKCHTMNGVWGWVPGQRVISFRECIHLLSKIVCRDGNLLLNVGPDRDGQIDPQQASRLREMGRWLSNYGECIYGTRGGPFLPDEDFGSTQRGDGIFLHFLDWPTETRILPMIDKNIIRSESLTGSGVSVRVSDKGIEISVPEEDRRAMITIIKLTLQ
jgi:alpha-L-fucosidase